MKLAVARSGIIRDDFFEKDVWTFEQMGVEISATKSDYQLNFKRVLQPWLKITVKRFIKLMATTRSHGSLSIYVTSLGLFSEVIRDHGITGTQNDLNRNLIVEYISCLHRIGLAPSTRKKRLLSIKLFLNIAHREQWLSIETPNLIYREDIPREPKAIPKFIPENIMAQLNANIELLDKSLMRLILVIQECGMRINEIATLPFSCVIKDNDGDNFLQTHQSKMNKDHTIPITIETYNIICEQQDYVIREFGNDCEILFPMEKKNSNSAVNANAGKPYKTRTVIRQLNRLATIADINNEDGEVYHFTTHMFRHTVGTRMINNGVPQHIVQRYLGHESPAMTSTYAHVLDTTMKREFIMFKGIMVDITGQVVDEESIARDISQDADVDAQWLKRHISAQALPNGLCAMPVVQSCDKANACLTCGNFRTDVRYLNQHKEQLERTCSILDSAKQNGWSRQIEMNEKLKISLVNIIEPLEAENGP